MKDTLSPEELLEFYVAAGADEAMGDEAVDRTKVTEKVIPIPTVSAAPVKAPLNLDLGQTSTSKVAAPMGAIEAMEEAKLLAAGAKTLEELRVAIDTFQGLSIKRSATQMVFSDGNPDARVMLVGEAPGADEDRAGRPFVGVSGQLLDKMLGAIGLNRADNIYISNVVNWRPPGNRTPDDKEIALSLPFIQRHIELVNPAVLILAGGVACKALLQTPQGITKLRGRWIDFTLPALKQPVPLMPLFHPAYLLRSPQHKGMAWADLLMIKRKLQELGIIDAV